MFFPAIILLLSGCEKNPYVSEDVIRGIRDSAASAKSISNIGFIYLNDIYFMDNIDNSAQRITNTPGAAKTGIALSHNCQKIAYINASGNPVIIDRNDSVLATLSYTGIKQMDWSNNDATLYMLIGNQFFYYGPALTTPALNFPSPIPVGPYTYVVSASLSKDNDLAYVVEYFDGTYGTMQKLVIKKNDGSGTVSVLDNAYYPTAMAYAKFSSHDKDLVVGYTGTALAANEYEKLEVYTGLKNSPDQAIEYSGNEVFKYPVYRSDKKCLVSVYKNNNYSASPVPVLSAYFINDITFKNRTEYNASASDLIVDWK